MGLFTVSCDVTAAKSSDVNSTLSLFCSLLFIVLFDTKFGLSKIFDPSESRENVQTTSQKQAQKDTLLPVQQKKSQIDLKVK